MSDDSVYTLAVWSVFDAAWRPLATSPRRGVLDSLAGQVGVLLSWPYAVVSVPGGTDDDVEAVCGLLPAPVGFDWKAVFDDVEESIGVGAVRDAVHPPGDPNR